MCKKNEVCIFVSFDLLSFSFSGMLSKLLKTNADLVVNLRSALFFYGRDKSSSDSLQSLGVDLEDMKSWDLPSKLEEATNRGNVNYKNFNSTQALDVDETESRYQVNK